MKSVELFAGGGGLLLGSSMAGFEHVVAAEWNRWAAATLRGNSSTGYPLLNGLEVVEGDVRDIDWYTTVTDQIDLVTGGPPCQPFSMGGKARAADDPRDMFPAMTAAIASLRPRAFIVENVKGLTRAAFHDYYSFIKLRLTYPLIRARNSEAWTDHFARLQRIHTSGSPQELEYRLIDTVVNAADYGVPQHRHRVFLVGFRSDVEAGWNFPTPTHSGAALRMCQESGEYWDHHRIPAKDRVNVARTGGSDPTLKPWVTVRDALATLPEPSSDNSSIWMDHNFQPGAKIYPGHTGSYIDSPSKALKAGGHGVPGGENMIRYPDGSVRYFSIREAARIQTFPDGYALHGAWSEVMRQIGNAVPVKLGRIVAESVAVHLAMDAAIRNQKAKKQSRLKEVV